MREHELLKESPGRARDEAILELHSLRSAARQPPPPQLLQHSTSERALPVASAASWNRLNLSSGTAASPNISMLGKLRQFQLRDFHAKHAHQGLPFSIVVPLGSRADIARIHQAGQSISRVGVIFDERQLAYECLSSLSYIYICMYIYLYLYLYTYTHTPCTSNVQAALHVQPCFGFHGFGLP